MKIAAGLILLALIRIAATFTVLSETTDEAVHVAVGLHLLTQHRYGIQYENPPLVPIVLALPLVLAHVKVPGSGDYFEWTHCVFYSLPSYKTSLVLARAGNLLFFAIAAAALWAWAKRELGERAALIALLLFTMEPILLGYSGLATHDAGAMAGVAVSLLAFSRWLERRSWQRAAAVGAAFGFAILCKFSCIAFVPVACVSIFVVRSIRDRALRTQWRSFVTAVAIPVVAFLIVCLGYGFSLGSFVRGVKGILEINARGMTAYAFGRISSTGWWWYFPATIVLKTTLPLLILIVFGFIVVRRDSRLRGVFLECMAGGAAILAVAMTAHLDLGIRYVLAAYVAWIVAAAAAVEAMLASRRQALRFAAMLLIAIQTICSFASHPDYFPYFNAFGGRDPSRYLTDSNLDWGQDVLRLRSVVRQLKIDSLGTVVFGAADLDALGFPKRFDLNPTYPTAGWIAISDHAYRMDVAQRGRHWLSGRPYRRIGKSIRLYYVQ